MGKNSGGHRTLNLKLFVQDTCAPVTDLKISSVFATRLGLSWLAPDNDGCGKIESYTIEKRETSRIAWTLVANGVQQQYYKVQGLLRGNEYVFRVRAENRFGSGEPCI